MSLVFSIEEFSTFDGPGIRTTVFLKGCPLRCVWCHNPEGQSAAAEYVRGRVGCLGCGACERAAERTESGIRFTRRSAESCPRDLIRLCGVGYTPNELANRLLKNARVLKMNEGGVTFSGGEPLSDFAFLAECAALLKGKLHVAVQTCGCASAEKFDGMLGFVDYVLYDLKLMDKMRHIRYCGADNAAIKRNYASLVASGVPFVTRVPLIPDVTDTEENLSAIAAFMAENGVKYVETMPYNKFAGSKYASLARVYRPEFDEEKKVNTGENIFAEYGVVARKL